MLFVGNVIALIINIGILLLLFLFPGEDNGGNSKAAIRATCLIFLLNVIVFVGNLIGA